MNKTNTMQRKEFLSLSVPAFLLLANGKIVKAHDYFLSEEHRRKVKLRFVVASDGHYGQPNTDYENFFSTAGMDGNISITPFRVCNSNS